jgi:hypothetical protein
MKGVRFEPASEALPTYCLAMMEGTTEEQRTALVENIAQLSESTMSDQLKSYNLGLALIRVTGVTVLTGALTALRDDLVAPVAGDPPAGSG